MGKICAVCTSPERGTPKSDVGSADAIVKFGLAGDAHGGDWHRQISLLSLQKIEEFRALAVSKKICTTDNAAALIPFGAFGENLVVDSIDFSTLPTGSVLLSSRGVTLEITQHGKECRSHCKIFERMGDCIMPREGVFAIVKRGGT
jgi:TatD DNase family protein